MDNHLFLGIDIGTSSLKCVVFDEQLNDISIVYRKPNIIQDRLDFSELSMDNLWEQVVSALQEIFFKNPPLKDNLTSIGISGTACGCWLLGKDKKPIRNAILWNDGRAANIVGEWQKSGVLDEIFRISGNIIFPGYPIAILRWLGLNEPDTISNANTFLFCKDWIRYKLTGNIAVEHSDMGYFPYDIKKKTLSQKILSICGISETERLIPTIIESSDIAGYLRDDIADVLGITKKIPVVAGLVDVAATTFGSGAYKSGQSCSIVGTSFVNTILTDSPTFTPSGIGVQTPTTNNLFARSLINTSGTINLEWFLNTFCENEQKTCINQKDQSIYQWAENMARQIPIGSEGIIYHPYINTTGVISPFVNPTARAQFFGVCLNHSRAHFIRAIYEGTALSMLDCYNNIPKDISEVYISGGGSKSPFWCQMFADCTGKNILIPKGSELGAKGVSILAGLGAGIFPNLKDLGEMSFQTRQEYVPNMENHQIYLELYAIYKNIYAHVSNDWWDRHKFVEKYQ